jgi:GntR family transcriptional regulator
MIVRPPSVPLWAQIEHAIRNQMESGQYPIGSRLPSEPDLCQMFGVSRMTVRQAVQQLVDEGRLVRGRGRGTFVARPPLQREINSQYLDGFFATLTARGHTVSSRVLALDRVAAGETAAAALGLATGVQVYRLERLRLVDGAPVSVQIACLPVLLVPGLERFDFGRHSLYGVLREEYGLQVSAIEQKISARAATPQLAHLMDLPPGSPLLYVEKISRTRGAQPLEFGELYFDPAGYQLTMAIRSGPDPSGT